MDDFARYRKMQTEGSGPADVHRAAVADGLDRPALYRLLRSLFGLSVLEAKKVIHGFESDRGFSEHLDAVSAAVSEAEDTARRYRSLLVKVQYAQWKNKAPGEDVLQQMSALADLLGDEVRLAIDEEEAAVDDAPSSKGRLVDNFYGPPRRWSERQAA